MMTSVAGDLRSMLNETQISNCINTERGLRKTLSPDIHVKYDGLPSLSSGIFPEEVSQSSSQNLSTS